MRSALRWVSTTVAGVLIVSGLSVVTATTANATPAPWTIVEKTKVVAMPRPGEVSDSIACDQGYTPISGGTNYNGAHDKAQRRNEYVEWGSGATYSVFINNAPSTWDGATPQFTMIVRCVSLSSFPNGMVQVDTTIPIGSNHLAAGSTNPCPAGRIAISASMDWNGSASGIINTSVPDYEFDQWYVSGYNTTLGTSMFISTHCVSTADVAGARLYTAYTQIGSNQTIQGRLCPQGLVPLAGGQFESSTNGGGPNLSGSAYTIMSHPMDDGWMAYTPYQSPDAGAWMETTLWCQPKYGIGVFGSAAPSPNPNSNTGQWTFSITDQSSQGGYSYSSTCSLDGGAAVGCSSPWTSGALSDGTHSLKVNAASSDGRTATTTISLRIDTTPPALTLTAANKPIVNTSTTLLYFTATDVGIWNSKCWVDSGTQIGCNSPWNSGSLADGAHVLHVVATDDRGNASQANFTVQVDTVAPALTVTGKPPAMTTSASATFGVSGTDAAPSSGGLTVECRLDTAAYAACPTTNPFSSLADGTHTFQARATDAAQNQSVDTTTWMVDTTAPVITLDPNNATAVNSSSPSFAFGVNDVTSGVASSSCWLDAGTPTACTSPYAPAAPVSDGPHTMHIRATDNAGNQSEAALDFAVDTAAPVVAVTNLPSTLSPSASASISVTASDPSPSTGGLVVTCHLDSAPDAACPVPAQFSGLSEGAHTFSWKAADAAGNQTSGFHQWTVDTIAPVVTVDGKPAPVTESQSASFTTTATDSNGTGVTSFVCHLDDAAAADCTSPSYASLPAGTHTFYWSATDAAGNTTTGSYAWRVDLAAPTVAITSGPLNGWSNQSTATFGFAGSDDGPADALTYKCAWDNGAFVSCTTPATQSGLAVGNHSFAVVVTDAVGHQALASRSWTIETTVPTAAMSAPTQLFLSASTTALKWTGSDSGSGIAGWEVQSRRAAWNAYLPAWPVTVSKYSAGTRSVSATGLPAGYTYCWRVRAVDAAGNRSNWSQKCTAVVLDDRSFATSTGWVRATGSGYYASTRTETTKLNATLTRTSAHLSRVALLATKCPTCGTVGVYLNGVSIGTVKLYASTTARALFTLPAFSLRTATVTIKVLTSGKLVRIDAVGVGKV